eukprot:gb/GECG01003415.1/.p1 GENE.gb/GECG01003415.1/~~gb/GECG01003415.1/.p1  ORF type:complete len:296 (+),score=50.00 gb/GECG01003415.1/:1-888(+)
MLLATRTVQSTMRQCLSKMLSSRPQQAGKRLASAASANPATAASVCDTSEKSASTVLLPAVFPRTSDLVSSSSPSGAAVEEDLRKCDAVCFDVDCTVLNGEGIDTLAKKRGKEKEVGELTNSAMTGAMPLEEALRKRLDIVQPSKDDIQTVNESGELALNPGVDKFIDALRGRGIDVYLVSGGLKDMILPFSRQLELPDENVFANILHYNEDGTYHSFDDSVPVSRSGGKALVLQGLKNQMSLGKMVIIGDGATDLEARPPADYFIGYGGVCVRENIKNQADFFSYDFETLKNLL